MEMHNKGQYEYLRLQAKQRFDKVRATWTECGRWVLPHRTRVLLSQQEGERSNQHIVDLTHLLALRSYVAGFLEGNTSASRPWYRTAHADPDENAIPENKKYLNTLTNRTLIALNNSNFYYAAGAMYFDLGTFNTGALYIDELKDRLHFHNLTPGTFFCLNNNLGVADILVREFTLTVKALVDTYGVKKDGSWDPRNFSNRTRKLYEDGNYAQKIDICHIVLPNQNFDPYQNVAGMNKQWLSVTYELGGSTGQYYQDGQEMGAGLDTTEKEVYLKISTSKRKPFIVSRGESSENFEYGEKGPTLDALGCIKSLNKKAIGKDIALDQMLKPATQGPASLKKSYISTAPNAYVPLDPQSYALGGLKPIHQMSPAISALNQDVMDLRSQVEKMYYADYLLYLTRNPKTRTATETNAVVQEQQLIIGPMLQSLNWTFNNPLVEFVIDYVLHEDPYMPPPPERLQGEFLRTEFISVFAQAQRAADLPAINQFVSMITNVGQLRPSVWDKLNLDKLADLYEDRLYLPEGLNRPQSKVEAMREQAQAQAQRQQMLQDTIPNLTSAAKDLGSVRQAQKT